MLEYDSQDRVVSEGVLDYGYGDDGLLKKYWGVC